ncbi:MAG: HNH endonuclease [Tissierellia bacterium]|nr:HNH endonuclease [Tissierellia bacterium]
MKKIYLKKYDGRYEADIDITVSEWKSMLQNTDIFNKESLDMVINWYKEVEHQATSKAIMEKYHPELKSSPYNGIVNGLATRIIKHLNRFEVIGTQGQKSKFVIPFEGWYEDYNPSKRFVWKLRDELAQALEELNLVEEQNLPSVEEELTSIVLEYTPEGKKYTYYTTRYERSSKNRNEAIKIHGTICQGCGFDFEKTYGEIGKNYIEVHHVKPLYEENDIVEINPATDLICVCANCHRMIHRRKYSILTLKELQELISANRNSF